MHNTFLIPKASSHNFSHWWHSWIYSFFVFHVAQLHQLVLNWNWRPQVSIQVTICNWKPSHPLSFQCKQVIPIAFLASLLASTFKQTVEKTNSSSVSTTQPLPLGRVYHNSFVMQWSLYISSWIWQMSQGITALQGRAFLVCHEIILLLLQLL